MLATPGAPLNTHSALDRPPGRTRRQHGVGVMRAPPPDDPQPTLKCGWNAVGAQSGWKCASMPPPLSHAYLVGAFAAGRSSAAIDAALALAHAAALAPAHAPLPGPQVRALRVRYAVSLLFLLCLSCCLCCACVAPRSCRCGVSPHSCCLSPLLLRALCVCWPPLLQVRRVVGMRWARKEVGSAPACPLPCRTLTLLVPSPRAEAAPPSPSSAPPPIAVLRPASGRTSAAIAILRPAPWAEATQPSPSSTPPFGPKQRRQRRPPPRCHGRQGTQWRAAVDAPPGNQPRRQKLALSIKATLWHPVVLQVSPLGTAHRTAATLTPRNAANRSIAMASVIIRARTGPQ